MPLPLRLAWRNLWRQPRRSLLTVAAIAFTSALLVFLISLQYGAYDLIIENSLRLYTGPLQVQRLGYQEKPRIELLIPHARGLARRLSAASGAKAAVRAQAFALASAGPRSFGVQVLGVEPEIERGISLLPSRLANGRYLSASSGDEAYIGEALARNLGLAVGSELTLIGAGADGSVAAGAYRVAGVFATGQTELDRSLVEIPLAAFQAAFNLGDAAHVLVLQPAGFRELAAVERRARAALAAEPGLALLDWDRLQPGLRQLIAGEKFQHGATYLCLALIVTFSILNTFFMSILERTREFGVMLALGVSPAHLSALVLFECALLTLLGLAAGTALGGSAALYYHAQGFALPSLKEVYAKFGMPSVFYPKLSFTTLGLGPSVILVFTLAGCAVPALRLLRLKAVEAMRAP